MPISDPSELPGPLGLWLFDEGSGIVAKNDFAATPNPGTNWCYAPEQSFDHLWTRNLLTVTEYAGNNPNGVATATRFQLGAGNAFASLAGLNVPAGQKTISAYFKANAGVDADVRLAMRGSTDGTVLSSAQTVTNAGGWQRKTFTNTMAGATTEIRVCSDGTNAADVLVWGVQFEDGASATAYRLAALDFLFPGSSGPTWITEGLRETTGTRVFPAYEDVPTTFAAGTAYAVIKQSSTANSAQVVMYDKVGFTTFASPKAKPPGGYFGAGQVDSKPLSLNDGLWHVLAVVWNGTTVKYYIDKVQLATVNASTGWTSKGILLGHASIGFQGDRGVVALFDDDHSASEVEDFTDWARTTMAGRGVTITDLATFIQLEGDSITASSSPLSHAYQAMNAITPVYQFANSAVAGARIADISGRSTANHAYLTHISDRKILYVMDGNDLADTTAAAAFTSLTTYLQGERSHYDVIVLGTTLPRTTAGFNTKRATYNQLKRDNPSLYDILVDYDTEETMGLDATASDTTYYSDGVHPTLAGQTLLAPLTQAGIEEALTMSLGGGGNGRLFSSKLHRTSLVG